jgi:hypothetical protein
LIGAEWITSTSIAPPLYERSLVYGMPLVYHHMDTERKVEKVSTMRMLLNNYLELMKDKTTLNALHGMIDQCTQDKESLFLH